VGSRIGLRGPWLIVECGRSIPIDSNVVGCCLSGWCSIVKSRRQGQWAVAWLLELVELVHRPSFKWFMVGSRCPTKFYVEFQKFEIMNSRNLFNYSSRVVPRTIEFVPVVTLCPCWFKN
jgi:hypothetical protein